MDCSEETNLYKLGKFWGQLTLHRFDALRGDDLDCCACVIIQRTSGEGYMVDLCPNKVRSPGSTVCNDHAGAGERIIQFVFMQVKGADYSNIAKHFIKDEIDPKVGLQQENKRLKEELQEIAEQLKDLTRKYQYVETKRCHEREIRRQYGLNIW